MKKMVAVLLLLITLNQVSAQLPKGISANTNLYFVRHAEKETGNDPSLTEKGKKRAGDLMRYLHNKKITRIYVTQFKRTQMTADSLYLQLAIDTIHYLADEDGVDLFKKIAFNNDFNKKILIVGHSNTIPDYIKKAGIKNFPEANISDLEFDNIYKVYYRKPILSSAFRAKLKPGKYGVPSSPSAKML